MRPDAGGKRWTGGTRILSYRDLLIRGMEDLGSLSATPLRGANPGAENRAF